MLQSLNGTSFVEQNVVESLMQPMWENSKLQRPLIFSLKLHMVENFNTTCFVRRNVVDKSSRAHFVKWLVVEIFDTCFVDIFSTTSFVRQHFVEIFNATYFVKQYVVEIFNTTYFVKQHVVEVFNATNSVKCCSNLQNNLFYEVTWCRDF